MRPVAHVSLRQSVLVHFQSLLPWKLLTSLPGQENPAQVGLPLDLFQTPTWMAALEPNYCDLFCASAMWPHLGVRLDWGLPSMRKSHM